MQVVLIRHAKAEDREAFARTGRPDAERPLTDAGRKKMGKAARGLASVIKGLDRIFTSPFLRTAETAAIVGELFGVVPEELDALAPGGSPLDVVDALGGTGPEAMVGLVGHEPDLGRLASWFLAGAGSDFVPMKKGGAVLIRFRGDPASGRGSLVWAVPPALLRGLV